MLIPIQQKRLRKLQELLEILHVIKDILWKL